MASDAVGSPRKHPHGMRTSQAEAIRPVYPNRSEKPARDLSGNADACPARSTWYASIRPGA